MRAYFAVVVPLTFGFYCTSTLAQTATPQRPQPVVKIAHVGDESVTLRFIRTAPPPNPRDAFKDDFVSPFFKPLAAYAAAGDDWAAAYLWEELRNCRGVPSTEAEQRAQLEKIPQQYAIANDQRITLDQVIDMAKRRYQRCEGITEASYTEALGILRDAADHGTYARAQLDYANAIAKDQPDEARQLYEALWSDGHLAALAGLAGYSLAYRIASDAAQIAITNGSGPAAAFQARADQLRNETSPSAYNEAAKKAGELLRNPKCCISP